MSEAVNYFFQRSIPDKLNRVLYLSARGFFGTPGIFLQGFFQAIHGSIDRFEIQHISESYFIFA